MRRKMCLVLAGLLVAVFVPARARWLTSHGTSGGAVAWAQDLGDATESPAQDDSEQTAGAIGAKKPPTIELGTWCGSVDDHEALKATLFLTVGTQEKSKLTGTWAETYPSSPGGSFTAKIKPDGKTIVFKFKISGSSCKSTANATLITPKDLEIEGTYTDSGCKALRKDFGNFDIFFPCV
ncbi:MAG TPA: hypothetical protein VEC38_11920 [Candidatus Binataceae bacterium]|nr:hypothetical protein [Candidatus Binataceae bacterium]